MNRPACFDAVGRAQAYLSHWLSPNEISPVTEAMYQVDRDAFDRGMWAGRNAERHLIEEVEKARAEVRAEFGR